MDQIDDTQPPRKSDAAATRKRRSSILKSQRPPRTPFSELEFHVATPTDTAKSRRVSFSRKTGVAEFARNEATTTWKNLYEEHNKSHESSNNDSGIKQSQQTIAHLGKRVFDQQFEEVEVFDFGNTIDQMGRQVNSSINHVNFHQSLECTVDKTLAPAQQNFELSALTANQSKFFGDDLLAPVMGENSGRIDINFSSVNSFGGEVKDDLDEIQKDVQRSHSNSNVVCHGPFNGNNSEYLEVDLNMTHVAMRNDEDMSITDTIHSPKVQEVSKTSNQIHNDKLNNDWIADKENIVMNPYVAPKESQNFALNEEPNKVLVFDGKRLTIQTDSEDVISQKNVRKTLSNQESIRKTIVLNVNDDLPNFINDANMSKVHEKSYLPNQSSIVSGELSMTQPLPGKIEVIERRRTMIYDDDLGDISVTQGVPANVIMQEKRKTVVYENDEAEISMTQALPHNIFLSKETDKRSTIIFDDVANVSMTKAIPSNIIATGKSTSEKRKTIVFDDVIGNLSITQAVPVNIIIPTENKTEKRKTILYENETGNISVTQALPAYIIPGNAAAVNKINKIINVEKEILTNGAAMENVEKRRTIVFENDTADISITQAIPSNIIMPEMKRKTIIFEDNFADISVTQAVPSNLIQEIQDNEKRKTIDFDNNESNISITQAIPSVILGNTEGNKRKTIVFNTDNGDISMTQAVPTNLLAEFNKQGETSNKRKTIVYDNDTADISITQAISSNLLLPNENRKTIVCEDTCDISSYKNKDQSNDLHFMSIQPENNTINDTEVSSENNTPEKVNIDDHKLASQNIDKSISEVKSTVHKKIDTEEKLILTAEANNVIINESVKLPKNESLIDEINMTNIEHNPTKPISTDLTSLQDKIIDKSVLDTHYEKQDAKNQDIFVYQASTKQVTVEFDNNVHKENVEENYEQAESVENGQQVELASVISDDRVASHSVDRPPNKNLLCELLDMSYTSLVLTNDKMVSAHGSFCSENTKSEPSNNPSVHGQEGSKESFFFVTRDSYIDVNKNEDDNASTISKPVIDSKEEVIKISETCSKNDDEISEGTEQDNESNLNLVDGIYRKSIAMADTTKDLLKMLAQYTDDSIVQESETASTALEIAALETKSSTVDLRKSNIILRRQSLALSREDLINNISMAQAMLQNTRMDLDDSNDVEDAATETFNESETHKPGISHEVVKKLQFEDEPSNVSVKSEMSLYPLKKSAFGETTYLSEDKSRVIPTYLKDVSDGVKQLMLDLIKPNDDVFQPLEEPTNLQTTNSAQIQTNLITSSQIDMDPNDMSCSESIVEDESIPDSLKSSVAMIAKKSISHALQAPISSTVSDCTLKTDSYKSTETEEVQSQPLSNETDDVEIKFKNEIVEVESQQEYLDQEPGTVLYFDENNPLNNVLLNPEDRSLPKCMRKKKCDSTAKDSVNESPSKNANLNKTKVKFDVDLYHTALQSGDASLEKLDSSQCKKDLQDKVLNVKDTEANTVIAMKANKELLEASSSLTLVDDAKKEIDENNSNPCIESKTKTELLNEMYEIQEVDSDDNETDKNKAKKRFYSPNVKGSKTENVEVTPKPISKIQKLSASPIYNISYDAEDQKHGKKKNKRKNSPKKGSKKHQSEDKESENDVESEKNTKSDGVIVLNEIKSVNSVSTFSSGVHVPMTLSDDLDIGEEIHSDLSINRVESLDDKAAIETESDVNIVEIISMQPFMVKNECEWNTSTSDSWSFHLLHSRLRLCVRLACTNGDLCNVRVREHTKVLDVSVEKVVDDNLERNPISPLCADYALRAMRIYIGRGCTEASSVVALLRRCAAVSRVAARWGRAMQSAMAHLAFTVHGDIIKLHVANVPLRSVWEVSIHTSFCEDVKVPYPRAVDVQISSVVGVMSKAIEANMRRSMQIVPADWGHVPRTIWRVFRHLKNKTVEDESLLGL